MSLASLLRPPVDEGESRDTWVGPIKPLFMTLAAIAYASSPDKIQKQLSEPSYATKGHFKLLWVGQNDDNLMYITQQIGSDLLVLVIRGTATKWDTDAFWYDWLVEDFEQFRTVTVPWTVPEPYKTARISQGAYEQWNNLHNMSGTDYTVTPASPSCTLLDFLSANLKNGAVLGVTGHSAGGTAVSFMAPLLYEKFCRRGGDGGGGGGVSIAILPVSFAGPTAGDATFANYVNSIFGNSFLRCANSLDVAPHVWTIEGLDWVSESYGPEKGPVIDNLLHLVFDGVCGLLELEGINYVQPGKLIEDTGSLSQVAHWYQEAVYQHHPNTYLTLYGAHIVSVHRLVGPPPTELDIIRRRAVKAARRAVGKVEGVVDEVKGKLDAALTKDKAEPQLKV
eukprot:TRINITY_DN14259_c0_g2_i1.p1 TRINITY_DN14259_c0_g2~~TRINITY_DN14259_c0_g2_i1.p1  ORF type:complete len:394 (+),score=47.30 TRINITY_DN14259_c0_g2_i1:184-1365(+)